MPDDQQDGKQIPGAKLMNPKNVWSIVLIVVGVGFVIGGVGGLFDATFYGNEIENMNHLIRKYTNSTVINDLINIEGSRNVIRNTKIYCIISMLIGIAGAVCGTLLLSDKPKTAEAEIDDIEMEDNEPWRL